MLQYDEVISKTAKKLNLPEKQVRIIMIDFFHKLLMVLQHPEDNFLRGIKLEKIFKISLDPSKVLQAWKTRLYKNKWHSNIDNNIRRYHEILLENDRYTKKQKEAAKYHSEEYLAQTQSQQDNSGCPITEQD